MKQTLFIFQVFILLFQGLIFAFSSSGDLDFLNVNLSALTVFISFIISWSFRNKTSIKGYGFSIIGFFVLMNWIISFQIPLELVYGNTDLLSSRYSLIYDINILNNLVALSSLMLNFLLLGVTYSYSKIPKFVKLDTPDIIYIPTRPLLLIMIFLLGIYIITVNPAYVNGGHGRVGMGSIAESTVGIALKLNAVYIALILFNFKNRSSKITRYIRYINPIYLVFLTMVVAIFLMAHNRSYVIMLATPLLFSAFVATHKKISLVRVLLVFMALSSFATFFKVYGTEVFSQTNLELNEGLLVSNFFFPMTAELAASIYSSNILYSLYDEGILLNGMSFLVGLLRTFPGIVSFIEINPVLYNSGVLATVISNTEYGVGTTAFSDLLINFGVTLSLLLSFFLGYFFSRSEVKAYNDSSNIYAYIVYLSICVLILFYPRGSLNDLLPTLLFNLLFFKFYQSVFVKKRS